VATPPGGRAPIAIPVQAPPRVGGATQKLDSSARLLFFAGKGGVGKTSCATSVALQLAQQDRGKRYTIISVDPAHALRDVFAAEPPPPNLAVETIDTRAKWQRFRDTLGGEIERAIDGITPSGLTVAYDTEALQKLIEIAPPGADELFAISRLASLIADESQEKIIVDTAPTGHFLRLLELPRSAGEWVREFMRLLLRYRELIPSGSLGEELVNASKSLKQLDTTLHSSDAGVVVVTRPERIVVAETDRLIAQLRSRKIALAGVVANYVTPPSECPCDTAMRVHELAALRTLGPAITVVHRLDAPPAALDDLARFLPLASD
jgi:arsenite/tail-anchored protein-transporting ATPase